MSNKFGVAYAYGEEMDKVLVMNGTTVAEFHPRPQSDLMLLNYLNEESCHPDVGPSNTSNSDYLNEGSARTRGKGHLSDESIRGKNHLSEEGRDTGSEVRMLQHEREQRAYLSCVAQTESTGDGASTTSAPHESEGHGPIKEDNISMGSKGAQVTDEVVAADWTKEPLTQVDLSQLEGERSKDEIEKLMRVIWEYRHLLSDGHLDFTKTSAPKHSTVCRIATSVEDPHPSD